MQKYRALLDGDSSEDEASKRYKKDIFEEIGKGGQLEGLKQDEDQERQLLQDFYREMNMDADAEFAKDLGSHDYKAGEGGEESKTEEAPAGSST